MFPSILTYDFDLILGLFFTFFGALKGCFWVPGMIHTVVGSTHVVEQLSFSVIPSILTFEIDLILG